MGIGRSVRGVGLGMLLGVVGMAAAAVPDDWRLEMLKQEGFSGGRPELEALVEGYAAAEEGLDGALADLAAEDFKTRERAQAAIMMAGDAALSWMAGLPRQDDPEVRVRLKEIRARLRFRGPGSREELLRYAVKSLLAERQEGGGGAAAQLVFAEWFGRPADPLARHYGRFAFQADAGMGGKVAGGRLRFAGNRPGDGDQYVVLTADALGRDGFPGLFRVSCRMGGDSDDGSGGWHAGVSVGQVRVLYHPGMSGGSFRIETTGGKTAVRPNQAMGFDPDPKALQRIEIGVRTLKTGDVELAVVVASADGEHVFRDKTVVEAEVIGAVDRVGLWRSGRTGSDAVFDDFVLDLRGE